MKTYEVTYTVTYEVDAKNEDEAKKKAGEMLELDVADYIPFDIEVKELRG